MTGALKKERCRKERQFLLCSILYCRDAHHLSISKEAFAELLITEYPPGSVINWHRDAPPFDSIAGISLLSDCTFKLRPHDKTKQSHSTIISFPVQQRSLYILQGLARIDWQHSIAPVKQMRYSMTLRTLKLQCNKVFLFILSGNLHWEQRTHTDVAQSPDD